MQRIRKAKEFGRILASGKRIKGEYLQLYLSAGNQSAEARLGISIRRDVGSAVARNRSRRLVREVLRLHSGQLPAGTNLVVAVIRDISRMKLKEVERIFSEMISSSDLVAKH